MDKFVREMLEYDGREVELDGSVGGEGEAEFLPLSEAEDTGCPQSRCGAHERPPELTDMAEFYPPDGPRATITLHRGRDGGLGEGNDVKYVAEQLGRKTVDGRAFISVLLDGAGDVLDIQKRGVQGMFGEMSGVSEDLLRSVEAVGEWCRPLVGGHRSPVFR